MPRREELAQHWLRVNAHHNDPTTGANPAMPDNARSPLESVDRALQLLTALRDGQALSVKEAADLLAVAPPTAHRLLAALSFRQFAHRGEDRAYRALTSSTGQQLSTSDLKQVAQPGLEFLHSEVGESAQLMIRLGTHIRFIDGIESERPLRVAVRVGDLMPAHTSSGGKALLATLSTAELRRLYADGLPPWPTASTTTVASLLDRLRVVRKQGYGVNRDETEPGVSGVGVTILDGGGSPAAAFTLAVPSARFSKPDIPAYAATLRRASLLVSERLRDR